MHDLILFGQVGLHKIRNDYNFSLCPACCSAKSMAILKDSISSLASIIYKITPLISIFRFPAS
ncbi:MAG: hypothetical protein IPO37_10545 [Saprospiraceae bacterium]|nr:hypothetical protein [Saprospiraceae bacterium]